MEKYKIKTCCVCKKKFTGFGNNPWPLFTESDDDVCCDACNMRFVIPARIERIAYASRQSKQG